jgi:hypothetical protein
MPRRREILIPFENADMSRAFRELIAKELDKLAWLAMRSNEYNFNDTAVRVKTFMFAADHIRLRDDE